MKCLLPRLGTTLRRPERTSGSAAHSPPYGVHWWPPSKAMSAVPVPRQAASYGDALHVQRSCPQAMMRLIADLLIDEAQIFQDGYGTALHIERVHVKAMHVARLQDAFAHGSALVDAKFLRSTPNKISSIAPNVQALLNTPAHPMVFRLHWASPPTLTASSLSLIASRASRISAGMRVLQKPVMRLNPP